MSVAAPAAIVSTLAMLAAAEAVPAPAPVDDGMTLDVVGTCPDPAAVRRVLSGLIAPDEARAAPISVQDRGPRYRISVREHAVMIDDPTRDCTERARHAAVVAAGELHAPTIVFGPPVWTVEKGLVFEVAPGAAGGAAWVAGAEIRGAYGSRPWSLVGAAGARGPATLELEHGWRAEILRFPLDAGARLTGYKWKLRPWVVVGGSLTVTGIIGQELVQTDREWRADLGALAMAGATLPMFGRLGGAAALAVRWQPRPYTLQVAPVGKVGETPSWWFGLSLNYTLDGAGSVPP